MQEIRQLCVGALGPPMLGLGQQNRPFEGASHPPCLKYDSGFVQEHSHCPDQQTAGTKLPETKGKPEEKFPHGWGCRDH